LRLCSYAIRGEWVGNPFHTDGITAKIFPIHAKWAQSILRRMVYHALAWHWRCPYHKLRHAGNGVIQDDLIFHRGVRFRHEKDKRGL